MKTQHKRSVVAVDDDEINLMILIKGVQEAGFLVKPFSEGEMAWQYVLGHPGEVDLILADKMMAGTNGLDLLRRVKRHPEFRHIPVILQTGDVGVQQMREGLESGAYYYLTKPFHPEILAAILHSAANECALREELIDQMTANHAKLISLIEDGKFALKTPAEARFLAATISQAALYPEFVAVGLTELLTNAIEHGNLAIGYEKKRQCMMAGNWQQEIDKRMKSPEYAGRTVQVHMQKIPTGLQVTIKDAGNGFDWKRYTEEDKEQITLNEPTGRGIAKAKIMLDGVRYAGNGNEVQCLVPLAAQIQKPQDEKSPAAKK